MNWPRWLLVGLLAGVTALAIAVYCTPLFGVRDIEVTGDAGVDRGKIVRAAAVDPGTPMAQVDTAEVGRRLGSVPKVADAQVSLRWPSTLRIAVDAREPAAYQVRPGGVELVDLAGVRFARVAQPPDGLPRLRFDKATERATRTAMTALRVLPPRLREQVNEVSVRQPRDVRLRLSGGRTVHWGSAKEAERKARVLPLLLSQPGDVYDVTAPDLPTIADRD